MCRSRATHRGSEFRPPETSAKNLPEPVEPALQCCARDNIRHEVPISLERPAEVLLDPRRIFEFNADRDSGSPRLVPAVTGECARYPANIDDHVQTIANGLREARRDNFRPQHLRAGRGGSN
jgi:hypothetical protein